MLRSSSRSSDSRWRELLSLMDWMEAGTCGTLWAGSCWRCRVSRIAERVACWLAMMVTRAPIFVSVGSSCSLRGEGFRAGPIKVGGGGSALDLEEMESSSRWRECGLSAEMMDLREFVEPILRLEEADADDREPEVLVERHAVEMRGIGEGDSFGCGVAEGVWLEVSVRGSRAAVILPFSLILRSPDHTRRGELSSERRRTY